MQHKEPNPLNFSLEEDLAVDAEIEKFLERNVIEKCDHEQGEFISNIFLRPKCSGGHRVILSSKPLNKLVQQHHFKMDTIQSCINLMQEGCYMVSLALENPYYSIPVAADHQRFLKFTWCGHVYKFSCMVMGLTWTPFWFTKIMKVVFSHLRKQGFISSRYLDDIFLLGISKQACAENVQVMKALLTELGYLCLWPNLSPTQTRSCHTWGLYLTLEIWLSLSLGKNMYI